MSLYIKCSFDFDLLIKIYIQNLAWFQQFPVIKLNLFCVKSKMQFFHVCEILVPSGAL